jgi:hypothetical protein
VVTAVAASVALQRSLDEVIVHGRSGSARGFFSRFGVAWRRYWPVGMAIPAIAALYVFALLFWASALGWGRIAALGILVPLGGLAVCFCLATLAATASLPASAGPRRAAARGWVILSVRPLLAAGCLVLLATWMLLLSRIPTLGLIGLGLVPGFLALWLGRAPLPKR